MDEPIRVLHVDDDPDVLDRSRTSLEREHDGMVVVTATDATDGLALIDASTEIGDEREPTTIDCIVSEYQLPDMDGLAFFDAVREIDDSVPFLLFTDAGSEDVASRAVASGVAGYLRKDSPEPYALLANQIETVVSTARAQRQLLDSERVLRALHEATTDILLASDEAAVADAAVRIAEDILGFPMVAIHRFDPSRRGLVPIAVTGSIADRSMVDADEPLVWRAFETGEVRLYDDVRDHESTLGSQLSADLRSLLVIPIDDHGTLSLDRPFRPISTERMCPELESWSQPFEPFWTASPTSANSKSRRSNSNARTNAFRNSQTSSPTISGTRSLLRGVAVISFVRSLLTNPNISTDWWRHSNEWIRSSTTCLQ